MATRNKFEEMLERLINEDREGAEELFHEIVVEKSRDIYESLLEADLDDEEVDEASDEEVEESEDEDEDDDDLDENFNLDEFEVEADPMDMDMDMDMGGDPTDDMMGDMEPSDDDGMDMGGDDEDLDDRVEDLEDALNDLKAEFEKMMAGDDSDDEDGEDDDMDMDMDMGDEEDEDEKESFAFEADDDDIEEGAYKKKKKMSAGEQMREYVEKVNGGFGAKIGGDNGANAKSTVAGKNDMGGTTANLRGGESKSEGTKGGLAAPTPKDMNTKNVNVVGAKGATKMSNQPGHGAEKKGKPETADKGAGSPLNGAPRRAK